MYVYQYGLLFPFLLALLTLIGEYHTVGVFLDAIPFERLVFTWGYPDATIEARTLLEDSAFISNFIIR